MKLWFPKCNSVKKQTLLKTHNTLLKSPVYVISFHNSFNIAFVRIIMLIQYKIYKKSKAALQLVYFSLKRSFYLK